MHASVQNPAGGTVTSRRASALKARSRQLLSLISAVLAIFALIQGNLPVGVSLVFATFAEEAWVTGCHILIIGVTFADPGSSWSQKKREVHRLTLFYIVLMKRNLMRKLLGREVL